MTIRKGEDWGTLAPLPAGAAIARDNEELARFANVDADERPAAVLLLGGDLARTLGASGREPAPDEQVVIAAVDLGIATHDAGAAMFAAHAIARSSWWRGPIVGAFNAQFRGAWDVAPRSHPNDGRLDVIEVEAEMRLRQRLAARRRLATASHVPHPQIATRSVREAQWRFPRELELWLDGVEVGRTRTLRVAVEPDALTVCVATR